MPSQNIEQIYVASPITTNLSTDLMYFGRSPYGVGDDKAMQFSDFAAQFSAGGVSPVEIQDQAFTYGVDTGAANLYVVALSPAVSVYNDGQLFSFKAANSNTLTSFIDFGAGSAAITTNDGADLPAGAILVNGVYNLMYEAITGNFILLNPSLTIISPAQIQNQAFTYGFATGPTNSYAISVTPAVTSYADGQVFYFTANNRNTGISTLSINGNGAAAIVLQNNVPLSGSEILSDNLYQVIYNATLGKFILTNPSGTVLQNQVSTYAEDIGTQNALVVTMNPPFRYLKDGQFLSLRAAVTNNGPATINVDGLGTTPVLVNNLVSGVLVGGEIVGSGSYLFMYNVVLAAWILLNPSGTAGGGITPLDIQNQAFTYGVDAGIGYYQVNVTPAITSYVDGQIFSFTANSTSFTSPIISIGGVGTRPIVLANNTPMIGSEILINNSYQVMYNATINKFILLNPSGVVLQNQVSTYALDTGTADNYIVSYNPPVTTLQDGQFLSFRALNACTGGGVAVISVDALLNIALYTNSVGGFAFLTANQIVDNGTYTIIYSDAFGGFVLQNPT